ncbi:hypothetical protein [Falsiroseomonas sp.]|uniref:hypothetical protein n=1 Tax=Falsiroseomonas sp. TaxID=2870721 RepID=UPI003F710645
MTGTKRRLLLAAALAGTTIGGSAVAQPVSFCGGALVSQSLYSLVLPSGGTSQVEYRAALQNQDPQGRSLVAALLPVTRIGPFSVAFQAAPILLKPMERRDVILIRLNVNHSAGAGAPTPAQLAAGLRFSCSFS